MLKRFIELIGSLKKIEIKTLTPVEKINFSDVPDYGDHMELGEFKTHCMTGLIIDYDGTGYYATEDRMSDIEISPSDVMHQLVRKDFGYVVWFNK